MWQERTSGGRELWRHLLEIQRRVGNERDPSRLYPMVIAEISELLDADRSSLFLMDWDSMTLKAEYAQGAEGADISLALRMGVAGAAILRRQAFKVDNAYEHPYFNEDIDQVSSYRTESVLAVPIMDQEERALGCVELLNSRQGRFSKKNENMVRLLVDKLMEESPQILTDYPLAKEFIDGLCLLTQCDRGAFFVLDESLGRLTALYATGMDGHSLSLKVNLGVAGVTAVTGQPLMINDAAKDPRFDAAADTRSGYHTHSILCVPLVGGSGEVMGVVEVINKRQGPFNQGDLVLLEGVVSIMAIAIENALLLQEQESQFRSLLQTLAASIDAKDTLTAGHSTRVKEYSMGIAQELGFEKGVVDVLEVAALLHDYGKIGIDDVVLKKAGSLTSDEYSQMKQHVTMTRLILDKIRFARKYRRVPLLAAAHHEVLDGSGYDGGLADREIPFLTRIITVADVFEALTADRHYRKAMPVEKAFAILEEGVGGKYDAVVVDGLKRFWRRRIK